MDTGNSSDWNNFLNAVFDQYYYGEQLDSYINKLSTEKRSLLQEGYICKDIYSIIAKFSFCGIRNGLSLAQISLKKENEINIARKNQYPGSMEQDYHIEFLKYCSSETPLMKGAIPARSGGGYFLCLGGYGIVIDPGYQFIEKFHEKNYSLCDINAIIVTHFHGDHFADLPGLLALLYKYNNNPTKEQQKITICLDKQTYSKFKLMIEVDYLIPWELFKDPPPIYCGSILPAPEYILNKNITISSIPTSHKIIGNDTESGVGIMLDINKPDHSITRLIITGDTGWTDPIKKEYEEIAKTNNDKRVILIAHMSTVTKEELHSWLIDPKIEGKYYLQHLGLVGICKTIEILKPNIVAISEIGEEIYEILPQLCIILKEAYDLEDCIVGSMALQNPLKL